MQRKESFRVGGDVNHHRKSYIPVISIPPRSFKRESLKNFNKGHSRFSSPISSTKDDATMIKLESSLGRHRLYPDSEYEEVEEEKDDIDKEI